MIWMDPSVLVCGTIMVADGFDVSCEALAIEGSSHPYRGAPRRRKYCDFARITLQPLCGNHMRTYYLRCSSERGSILDLRVSNPVSSAI